MTQWISFFGGFFFLSNLKHHVTKNSINLLDSKLLLFLTRRIIERILYYNSKLLNYIIIIFLFLIYGKICKVAGNLTTR